MKRRAEHEYVSIDKLALEMSDSAYPDVYAKTVEVD